MFARLADAHLSLLYCTKIFIIQWCTYKHWAAQKQSRPHTLSSILPICINTHGQYTTPTCPNVHAYKMSQIFSRVFEFALHEFSAKFAKINAPQILPRLQYVMFNLSLLSHSWSFHFILGVIWMKKKLGFQ